MTRLNKYLAECGVCSRREADRLIGMGRVTVNNETARAGVQVGEGDVVAVDGAALTPPSARVVLAYNKPVGVTCTERDAHAERTIIEALDYPRRLTYAGRLDKESDGLVIMTNDGELIQRMTQGRNRHEKEYIVTVDRDITGGFLSGMAKGVYLPELERTTRPCRVQRLGKNTFRIVLTQGLNRQIRRMCRAFGYEVSALTRVRVMNVVLGDLESGTYRELEGEELETLYRMCGINGGGQ
ncbi:MAG: pseudouridine synthase [Roseburia sp.]|nr:pseudouridine synthase [Roseburia sp.]